MVSWTGNHLLILGEPNKVSGLVAEFVIEETVDKRKIIDFQKIWNTFHSGTGWPAMDPVQWGATWPAYNSSISYTPGSICADIRFVTPWISPYDELLRLLSSKYPDVYFVVVYDDCELGYQGYFLLVNGKAIGSHNELVEETRNGEKENITVLQ
jgi:hypothetical protein